MTLLSPARPGAPVSRRPKDPPVLCLLDVALPMASALHRAVLAAADLEAPLEIVVLHPRPGFTTDAAIAARQARQLAAQRDAVARVVESLLAGRPPAYTVRLQPYARRPWRDPGARARQAAERCLRQTSARAVVTPEDPSRIEIAG